jgi:LAO/AO transport system kinase
MLNLAHPAKRVFPHHGSPGTVSLPETEASHEQALWLPPIQRTVAIEGTGIQELGALIAQHLTHLEESGDWHQRTNARLQAELDNLLQATLVSRWRRATPPEKLDQIFTHLTERRLSPRQAVDELLEGVLQP